ncbi:MAG: RICIN domain-containing protein [Bacilli bacterium]|nr:RICIN domain-containing protein [Bacilli bacterium]
MKKRIAFILLIFLFLNINNVYATSTIKNGTYVIESAVSSSKVIDLNRGSTTSGTNIQLYQKNGRNNQKWKIEYIANDDSYSISSIIDTNKVFEIFGGHYQNFTNIQLYNSNNRPNQRWYIKHIGNGYFNIVSSNKNYCVDVNGGKSANGTNIQLYKCNNSTAQKFKLVEEINHEKTIDDGIYVISTALSDSKVLDVHGASLANKTNIEIYQRKDSINQRWRIKYLSDGYYKITSMLSNNKCLDINGAKFIPGSNIQLYNCNNSTAQKFIIKKANDDYYYIISSSYSMYLDVYGNQTNNGTNISLHFGKDGTNQKYKFIKLENNDLANGVYTIKATSDDTKALDVYGGTEYEEALIKLYNSKDTNNQKWYIIKEEDHYIIRSLLNPKYYLGLNSNNNLIIKSEKQLWDIITTTDGIYNIIPAGIDKYLSISDSSLANGTTISLSDNPSDLSMFSIIDTQLNTNDKTIKDGYYIIKSSIDDNKVMEIFGGYKSNNTNINLYQRNNRNNQIWYLKYSSNGIYSITSAMNPNINFNNTNDNIDIYANNSTNNQKWSLINDKDGNFTIISKSNNKCVTLLNGNTDNKTNILLDNCNENNSQKFILESYEKQKVYKGVDISQYQKNIDWPTFANGIDFVILRAGYGDNWSNQDDKLFLENVSKCKQYNIPYGVYLYSYAKRIQKDNNDANLNYNAESAVSEAAHVMRLINSVSYKPNLKTSVYLDMEEDSYASLGKPTLTGIANKFCSIIQSNGYGCSVYANLNWLNNNLNTTQLINKNSIWVASWYSPSPTDYTKALNDKPSYSLTGYKLWQFSDNGTINGYRPLDLDLGYNIFD